MRINFRIILLALPLAFGACSESSETGTRPASETISVSVGSGPKIDIQSEDRSRTQLAEDGLSVKWTSDDQIALWALNSRSETILSKQPFKLYHYNSDYNTAKFRSDIPQMPADTYTYYAVSPVPAESKGTQASYLIPDVQNGDFDGNWDVMVADPVKAPALEKNNSGETVQFQFRHKVHVLKISIPKNDLGEKISEITLAFPQPVTGRMTVDATDPAAAPVLSGDSNTLTLRFDTPKDAGDVVFAVIAPAELTPEQEVTITAIGETGESEPRNIPGKHFSEGHTTPIAYHIPALGHAYTRLSFSLPTDKGRATLGEAVEKITLTAPEGALFDNRSNVRAFAPDTEGKYTLVFKPSWTDNLSGKTVTVQYESKNAIVSSSLTMPQITEFSNNGIALSVPYLLAEDFSSISQNASSDDNPEVGGLLILPGNRTAIDLSLWGLSTPGWTAARVGVAAGKAVRICARVENQSFKSNTYKARIDSAPLSGIKSGKSVKVTVSFNYKGGRWSIERSLIGPNGPGDGNAIYSCGYTQESGWQPGSTAIPNLCINEAIIPGTEGKDQNQNQNYDNITNTASFTIPAAASTTRASWMVSSTTTSAPFGGFNGNYWLYLDNIKVSIVNE
ncbi:fimbrillin family protein [Alistipes sp.]|uniref:fimbrillin family protein n=1 Tax=Alistipes sp. TaxID=1872444 RepID=UPI0025C6F64A|nr:fimbrillin family protein [Alistipes sp.]